MTDLRIDLDDLRVLGTQLTSVASEFDNANARSDEIADAVGHGRLGDTVRDFAHGWDDRRTEIVSGIRSLGEIATAIADQFAELDGGLAAALDTSASEGAAR